MEDAVKELLQRHRAFWTRKNDRPLVQISSGERLQDLQQLRSPFGLGPLQIEEIDPARLVRPYAGPTRPGSDLFQPLVPPNMSWTEGMLGCPISIISGESSWAAPVDKDWPELLGLRLTPENPWQRKLLEVIQVMVEAAGGRLPVAQPMLRGPSDMVGALLSQTRMCTEVYDNPDKLKQLLRVCADIWIQSYQEQMEVIPSWHGGYCNVYGVWSPGTAMRMQEDASALFSPRHYQEFLLPVDLLIVEQAEYPVMHLHSGSLHVVDHLLEVDRPKAIQVAVDPPFGPNIQQLVPKLHKILAKKPLILCCYDPLSLPDAQQLVGSLPAQGLAFAVNLPSKQEAEEFQRWLGLS